ncbi:hypothetical protein FACS189491_11450 [Spirochaetia bacterium]|nr:hypothetical protein FACS189491_11450 [Spirochaetia bacterium]
MKKGRIIICFSIVALLVLSVVGLRFRVAQLHKISGYMDKGYAYYDEKDYDNAIIACNEAIRLFQIFDRNNSGRGYNLRGNVYSAKGDYVQAIADYTQAIKLDPDYEVYYSNRGLSYRAMGDYDSAIADFTSAIQIDPEDFDNAERYNWRAGVYVNNGEYDKAIADYNAALQINPDDTDAKSGISYVNVLKNNPGMSAIEKIMELMRPPQ